MKTCATCKHFTPSPNNPDRGFGRCATGAWARSYIPGTGYGLSPHPQYERQCDAMEPRS